MDAMTLTRSITASIETLAQETDAARISETMHAYLEAMQKFHQYSLSNQLLIAMQKPEATRVAGYQTWTKNFKRQVRLGEKGIAIFAPIPISKSRKLEEEMEVNTESKKEICPPVCGGFRVVYVFDVTQTEGDPLPVVPEWHDQERDAVLEEDLLWFAHSRGILVEIVQDLGGPQGTSSGGKIQILEGAGTRVLVHELVHELLEHANREVRISLSRQQREIEADAAAFVVGRQYNLTGAATPNYLALWQAAGADILSCMERVRGVSTQIIQSLEEHRNRKAPRDIPRKQV
jgi:hypothetical protein